MSRPIIAVAVCALATVSVLADDGIDVITIMRPGHDVPGLPGFTFAGAGGLASLNDQGLALFSARIQGTGVTSSNDDVLIAGMPGGLTLIGRERDPVFGLPDFMHLPASANHTGFYDLVVTASGETGYLGSIYPIAGGTLLDAVMAGPVGAAAPVLHESGPAPGFPSDSFTYSGSRSPIAGGGLGFIHGRATPVSNVNVLWLGPTGNVVPVLQTALQAPDMPIGVNIQTFETSSFRLNSQGRIGFQATLALGAGIDNSNRILMYEGPPDNLSVLARTGTPVPGLSGANFTVLDPDSLRMNAAGALCYGGAVVGGGTDEVLLVRGSGTTSVLVKDGDPVPGLPGLSFNNVSAGRIQLNGLGQVAFSARLTGAPSTADSGIFVGDPTGLRLVLREGDLLPGGIPAPDLFGASYFFNDRGQFAFFLSLSNGANLFVTRPNGELLKLAGATQIFVTDDGFAGVVGALVPWRFDSLAGSGGSGESVIFNNEGQLVLSMFFTGSTGSGVFMFDIDNPCLADLNCDGVLDFFDISSFLTLFSAGDLSVDFTGDGTLDFFDVSMLLQLFAAGCG